MGEVVNLRKVRKQKGRKTAEIAAAANRAKFGRTKAERILDEKRRDAAARAVDRAKLDKE